MKIAVGLNSKNEVIAAVSFRLDIESLKQDIGDMVISGLNVKVIEAASITIGKLLSEQEYTEAK